MELRLSWSEAARVCAGTLLQGSGESLFDSLNSDTRSLVPGQVFLALRGERFDGNEYQLQAADRGAAGFIVQRKNNRLPPDAPVLRVADGAAALQAIAAHHRARFTLKVAAVGGTNGKTTTKQLLAAMCAAAGSTVASRGNLNNQIGLPLSLLEIGAEHRFGVFELGSAQRGDVTLLAKLARPDAAVVTNVGTAHLAFFKTVEESFRTEMEVLESMAPDAPLALNLDDALLGPEARRLGARAIGFGVSQEARVRLDLESACLWVDGERLALEPKDRLLLVHPMNAAAAAAGALCLGLSLEHMAQGLRAFVPAPLRMEERRHSSGASLLVDAYNANLESMKEALRIFCARYPRMERVAVLGDMKELGEQSARLHGELGAFLRTLPLRAVYLGGPEMAPAAKALEGGGVRSYYAEKPQDWLDALRKEAAPDRAILFKASRAMAFEKLAETL